MRKSVLVLVLMALVFSCKTESAQPTLPPDTYQVNITAKGVYNGLRAHLNVYDNRKRAVAVDTAMIVNEAASFTGKISTPSSRFLTVNGVKGKLDIILEPGITNIEIFKDSILASVVDGGQINDDFNTYKKESRKLSRELSLTRGKIGTARRNNDADQVSALMVKNQELEQKLQAYPYEFIESHPDSDYSLYLLESLMDERRPDLNKLKVALNTLNKVIERNSGNQQIASKINAVVRQLEAMAQVEIGKIAPNFSAPTPDGEQLALNDIKGKATIVDFWASWCGPCRRENPNVVRVYNKYKDKGLEIISVSLDKPGQKQRWLDAIEKDKLDWHHVSNLRYFNDPVARTYNVNAIPATFILDEDGRIVAKKLRGQALEDQIASMLK